MMKQISVDYFQIADHLEVGQTSQYKRVYLYLSGGTSYNQASGQR